MTQKPSSMESKSVLYLVSESQRAMCSRASEIEASSGRYEEGRIGSQAVDRGPYAIGADFETGGG